MDLRERFYQSVTKSDKCWEWQGPRTTTGYGRFEVYSKGRRFRMRAHRLAYALEHGPIPTGLFVCHHCDNPICVRPDHLFLGTAQDNTDDRERKGRGEIDHLRPFQISAGDLLPGSRAALNAAKIACPKCGGPLVPVNLVSQGNRRRCPPCTQAAKNAYLKIWRAANR